MLIFNLLGATGQKKTAISEASFCIDDGSDNMLFEGMAEHADHLSEGTKTPLLSDITDNSGGYAPTRTVNLTKVFGSARENPHENLFHPSDDQSNRWTS